MVGAINKFRLDIKKYYNTIKENEEEEEWNDAKPKHNPNERLKHNLD